MLAFLKDITYNNLCSVEDIQTYEMVWYLSWIEQQSSKLWVVGSNLTRITDKSNTVCIAFFVLKIS